MKLIIHLNHNALSSSHPNISPRTLTILALRTPCPSHNAFRPPPRALIVLMVPVAVQVSSGTQGKFLAVSPCNIKIKLHIPKTKWHTVNLSFQNGEKRKESGAEGSPMASGQMLILRLCAWCSVYVLLRRDPSRVNSWPLHLDRLNPHGLPQTASVCCLWLVVTDFLTLLAFSTSWGFTLTASHIVPGSCL